MAIALDGPLASVDGYCNSIIWIVPVAQVIAVIGVHDIYVVVVEPVVCPVFRHRVNDTEPKATVFEARIPANHYYAGTVNAERVIRTKVDTKLVVGDAVGPVAAAFPP